MKTPKLSGGAPLKDMPSMATKPTTVSVAIPKKKYNPIGHLGDYAHPKGGRKKK